MVTAASRTQASGSTAFEQAVIMVQALVLLRASSSLSSSIRASHVMLFPLLSGFSALLEQEQKKDRFHSRGIQVFFAKKYSWKQKQPPSKRLRRPGLAKISFLGREGGGHGSPKSSPAHRQSVSALSSLPNPAYSLGERRVYPGGTDQLSVTVLICLGTPSHPDEAHGYSVSCRNSNQEQKRCVPRAAMDPVLPGTRPGRPCRSARPWARLYQEASLHYPTEALLP